MAGGCINEKGGIDGRMAQTNGWTVARFRYSGWMGVSWLEE